MQNFGLMLLIIDMLCIIRQQKKRILNLDCWGASDEITLITKLIQQIS